MMGLLWFNAFIFLGALMRRIKSPIKFSVVPLLLLLILSVLRMIIAIEIHGAKVIFSETFYPAIISFLRYEIVSYRVFGLPINAISVFVVIWITGTVWLSARYAYVYISRFYPSINWLESCKRDKHAESLLTDIIGSDKHFHVYRNGCLSTAIVTAFKPYIVLPEIDFSDDELRVILLHEWKHIQDKDYLTGIIVNVICFVFWWNPAIRILRKNFRFAGDDGLPDRLKVLALRGESRRKRILTNVGYSIVIFALFIASYMFIVFPAFWIPQDVPLAEDFMGEYSESGEIFMAEENFFIDNGDGTFVHQSKTN